MDLAQDHCPNIHAFSIERMEANAAGTAIFRLAGPLTARSMYECQTPDAVNGILSFHSTPDEQLPVLNILDLSEVPYVDSMGLGLIVTHYAHCQRKGIRMIAVGVGQRVLELFKLTRVDGLIPMAATIAEAGAR
jgi:ABC-type transporter Mla MlaB component